jgi:hypothetical protein
VRKPKRSARAARKNPTLEELLASAGRDPADPPAFDITPTARAAALNLHNPEFGLLLQKILEAKAEADGQSKRQLQQKGSRRQQQQQPGQSKQGLQPQVQSVMDWNDAAAVEQQEQQQIEQQVEEEAAPWGPAGERAGRESQLCWLCPCCSERVPASRVQKASNTQWSSLKY